MTRALRLIETPEDVLRPPLVESRVIGITFSRRDEHEFRSIMAWRKREHPGWSQFWSGMSHDHRY
jgi:hypothetical protein